MKTVIILVGRVIVSMISLKKESGYYVKF